MLEKKRYREYEQDIVEYIWVKYRVRLTRELVRKVLRYGLVNMKEAIRGGSFVDNAGFFVIEKIFWNNVKYILKLLRWRAYKRWLYLKEKNEKDKA